MNSPWKVVRFSLFSVRYPNPLRIMRQDPFTVNGQQRTLTDISGQVTFSSWIAAL
jgi:hypothetical protein